MKPFDSQKGNDSLTLVLSVNRAKLCGDAGLAIMKRSNLPIVDARCVMIANAYCLHWSTPLRSCMRSLLQGYKTGMKMGALDSASWCIHFYLEYYFYSGGRLALLFSDWTTYVKQMEDYDAQLALVIMKVTLHIIARLRGVADETEEVEYETLCEEKGEDTLKCVFKRTQMYVATLFGDHEKTAKIALEWQPKVMAALPAQVNGLEVTFLSALSGMAYSRQNPKNKKYLKHAKMCMKKIKG